MLRWQRRFRINQDQDSLSSHQSHHCPNLSQCLTALGLDVSFVFSFNLSHYIFLKMFLTTLQVFSSHEGTKEFFLNDHPKISQIIQKSQQFAETVLQKIINCIAFKFKFNHVAPLQEEKSCVYE